MEVVTVPITSELEASSLAKRVAHVLGVSPHDVPRDGDVALGQWLARQNLGLVPVESAETFAWPGHFLGRRRGSRTWAVLFGVPPGVVFEPERPAAPEGFDAAFVLAPHDPKREGDAYKRVEHSRAGTTELIAISAEAERPMTTVRSAEALAGRGLRGDRYEHGARSFSNPSGRGFDLTLVEAEALGLTRPGVLRGLVHRGGLRADVLSDGEIRVGDRVEALP